MVSYISWYITCTRFYIFHYDIMYHNPHAILIWKFIKNISSISIFKWWNILIILSILFLKKGRKNVQGSNISWCSNLLKRDIYRSKLPSQTAGFFPNKISFYLFFFPPLAQFFACNSRNTNYVQSTYIVGRSIFSSAINLSNTFQNSKSLKTRAEFQIGSL